MGKHEGTLWDDSALINAFDDAMSSYKKMHSNKTNEGSSTKQEEKVSISTGEQVITKVDESEEANRQGDADDPSTNASKTNVEAGETSNLSEVKENHHVDSHVPEPYSQVAQDVQNDYLYSQGEGNYNQLLNQYYEVEEKRQKLLEQLHQFGGWNYQYTGEGSGSIVQGDTAYSSQQHLVPTCQPSNPAVVCSCCPYICQCLTAPCTSFPATLPTGSCAGRTCMDTCLATTPGKSFSLEDGKIAKTAMGTAERALSSMKMRISCDSNTSEDKKDEQHEVDIAESTSSETDLTAVLNAWYSAGFYTGKYLVEQSMAKQRQS